MYAPKMAPYIRASFDKNLEPWDRKFIVRRHYKLGKKSKTNEGWGRSRLYEERCW
jgi:hypothetical protein